MNAREFANESRQAYSHQLTLALTVENIEWLLTDCPTAAQMRAGTSCWQMIKNTPESRQEWLKGEFTSSNEIVPSTHEVSKMLEHCTGLRLVDALV